MSLLSVVNHFCARTGLPQQATVIGSSDTQVAQIRALLEEEGNDLAQRGSWQALTLEASHTTVADEDQGALTAIASNGFRYIKNDTIWDRTNQLPVYGPISDQEWQARKAMIDDSPRYQYRIRGGKLLAQPAPAAGYEWCFEYVSQNWILGADGTTYKQYFTLDTDTILLPETLVMMGLRWRWLREKGLDYAELFRTYEMQVKDAFGRDGGKPILHMDGEKVAGPGVFVPSGSWISP